MEHHNEPSSSTRDMRKKPRSSKSKSKRSSRHDAPPVKTITTNAVTVSEFLEGQVAMQNETVRVIERRSKLANKQNNNRNGGDQKLLVGSEEDIHDDYEEGGVNSHSHANNRNALTTFNHHGGGHNNNNQMSAVDTVPSDHPSSTIIQTHRTCALVPVNSPPMMTPNSMMRREMVSIGAQSVATGYKSVGTMGGMSSAGTDVNTVFSGVPPEEERPTHIADCKFIDSMLSMPCYPNLNTLGLFTSSRDVSVSMAALEAVRLYGTLGENCFVPHDMNGEKVASRKKCGGGSIDSINRSGMKDTGVNPKGVICLVIGEGRTPRTAVLASQHYGWTALAIDPNLSEEWDGFHDDIPGFTGYCGSTNDFMDNAVEFTETMVEYSNDSVEHLVIIGIQMTKDQMRLRGRSDINAIRARYEDVPTTLVSLSPIRKATLAPKRRTGQCGSKLEKDVGYEPNCSYIDEGVFSACRLVEVWNFHNAEDDERSHGESGDYDEEGYDNYDNAPFRDDTEHDVAPPKRSNQPSFNSRDEIYQRFQDKVAKYEQEQEDLDDIEHQTRLSVGTLSTKEMLPDKYPQAENRRCRRGRSQGKKKERSHDERKVKSNSKRHDRKEKKSRSSTRKKRETDIIESTGHKENESTIMFQPTEDGQNDCRETQDNYKQNVGDYGYSDRHSQSSSVEQGFDNPLDDQGAEEVWGKALAKHNEQETFVNQFENYYGEELPASRSRASSNSTPPFSQPSAQDNDFYQQPDEMSESGSNFVCDDNSSASSGLRALSNLNKPAPDILGDTGSAGEEDDAFQSVWSDDEDLIGDIGQMGISPPKNQPWHKSNKNGNSFMSFDSEY
ncbi:predicted protein [Thalassiosira pseudonana CCMP1335]|uniref:Uncharacterized protein n=1 Tax=Thalassiosira pseudonana TaxID=35128 RepID=B8C121_THAPS|nr:predicted protein [Thalassiosira pseudonana CCMP1335]EED93163.1 predicted protein [Thalassiosira pseudonana CCMP1335]